MEILFKNKDIIAVIKPVGLDSEKQLPEKIKETVGGEVFALHRLDKNVGGVMVYARNKNTAAKLSKVIADGRMIKEYTALVHGNTPESGDWQDYLFKDSSKNKVYVVKKERKGVKLARLEFKKIRGGETSLVEVKLHTGRSHQIRVQFSSRGYPLVGDRKYGAKDDCHFPMLFSSRITFSLNNENFCFERKPEWLMEE